MTNLLAGEIYTLKTLISFLLTLAEKTFFRVELGQKCDRVPVCLGHGHIFIPFISAPLPLGTFCSTPVPVTGAQCYPPTPQH